MHGAKLTMPHDRYQGPYPQGETDPIKMTGVLTEIFEKNP